MEADQQRRMEAAAGYLQNLGYPDALVQDSINKEKARDQKETRKEQYGSN